MGKAPDKCPICGEKEKWKMVDSSNNIGMKVIAFMTIGPLGNLIPNEKYTYHCGKCGFEHEYN